MASLFVKIIIIILIGRLIDALNRLPPGFRDQMVLAPLTRGGNLPFRRLCADFGCKVSMGEMVYARNLLHGDAVEHARLRKAKNEHLFGVQIATNNVEEAVAALKLIKTAGAADFVDLNCGCPINEATRRGLGSALLRNPNRLAVHVWILLDQHRSDLRFLQMQPVTSTIVTIRSRPGPHDFVNS